jgi:tRNA(Ile)-lysidine synthase
MQLYLQDNGSAGMCQKAQTQRAQFNPGGSHATALVYNRSMCGNLVDTVEAALLRAQAGSALAVGVSGGMDSVVLAHLLLTLAPRRGLLLHLAHFDHALRPTSADDARFVAGLAAAWGLPFHTARWAHGDRFPNGVEAAARAARYDFLATVARTVAAASQQPAMVVAHHADDQAETLLLNLMRGSGLHGLAAMRMATVWENGTPALPPVMLLRPLLRVPRSALADYARMHALAWREDESNSDTNRTRNFVRHTVLPLLAQSNPAIAATLARTATVLAQEADRLETLDAQLLAQVVPASRPETRLLLRFEYVRALSWSDRCALLRLAVRRTFADCEPGLAHIEALAATLDAPPRASGPHPLVEGISWSIVYEEGEALLSIHRAGALPLEPHLPWLDAAWRTTHAAQPLGVGAHVAGSGGWVLHVARAEAYSGSVLNAAFDAWSIYIDLSLGHGLQLTTPQPGLRMAPLGMGGHTRSLGNIFTDRKVAPALRPGWPLIVDGSGRVLWLCGLVVAEGVQAQPGDAALHLRWVRNPQQGAP